MCQNAPLARMRRWRKNLKCSCTKCTLRFQNFSPPCLQPKSIILTQAQDSDTAPEKGAGRASSEKMLSNGLGTFEAKFPECIGILLHIPVTEIGEMILKYCMKSVFFPAAGTRSFAFFV